MKRFINEIKKKNIATLYMRMLNINMANRGCCKLLIYLQCVINYRRELAILATLISNVKQKNFLLLFFLLSWHIRARQLMLFPSWKHSWILINTAWLNFNHNRIESNETGDISRGTIPLMLKISLKVKKKNKNKKTIYDYFFAECKLNITQPAEKW